jgi:hypothetical protein
VIILPFDGIAELISDIKKGIPLLQWDAFLYPENPWLCQGFKEALAMSRKRKPPML